MKLITQKQSFFGDFYITRRIRLAPISSFSRSFIIVLLAFFATLFLNYSTLAIDKSNQQLPTKKPTPVATKGASSSKILKGKKSKKRAVVKKDTLINVDPASANSPLYNN